MGQSYQGGKHLWLGGVGCIFDDNCDLIVKIQSQVVQDVLLLALHLHVDNCVYVASTHQATAFHIIHHC